MDNTMFYKCYWFPFYDQEHLKVALFEDVMNS